MRQRKFKFLLVALLVVSGLMLAGRGVHAAVTDSLTYTGVFVGLDCTATHASYTYSFSRNNSPSTLSYIDFEIPVEIKIGNPGAFSGGGNGILQVLANGSGVSGEIYPPGIGDFGTKFGVGDTRYQVVKVNIPNPTASLAVLLKIAINAQTFSPKVFSTGPGVVLIKSGNGSVTQSFAINSPAVMDLPAAPPPAISSFSPSPNPSLTGLPVTLTWVVPEGTNVTITSTPDSGGGSFTGSGSVTVSPTVTTAYTLTATGPTGSTSTATTTVTVNSPQDVTARINFPTDCNAILLGECVNLFWSTSGATTAVVKSQVTSPTPGPIISIASGLSGSMQQCPDNTTRYTVTATGATGSVATDSRDVTVGLPPAPILDLSQQTFEKAGPPAANVTFYFANGVPVCSCTTEPGVILAYPCADDPLPANCSVATIDPVLVCLPFFGKTAGEESGQVNCLLGSENCMVIQIPPPSCNLPIGTCTARCDTLVDLTLDTTIEVGPHSCTCTTSRVRLLNGTYKTITSCTGSPCP